MSIYVAIEKGKKHTKHFNVITEFNKKQKIELVSDDSRRLEYRWFLENFTLVCMHRNWLQMSFDDLSRFPQKSLFFNDISTAKFMLKVYAVEKVASLINKRNFAGYTKIKSEEYLYTGYKIAPKRKPRKIVVPVGVYFAETIIFKNLQAQGICDVVVNNDDILILLNLYKERITKEDIDFDLVEFFKTKEEINCITEISNQVPISNIIFKHLLLPNTLYEYAGIYDRLYISMNECCEIYGLQPLEPNDLSKTKVINWVTQLVSTVQNYKALTFENLISNSPPELLDL